MTSYLTKFEKYRVVLLEFQNTKIEKANALIDNQPHREEHNNNLAATQGLSGSQKRKRKVDNRLESDKQLQNGFRNYSHFNFIKMQLLTHFDVHIARFGNIPMWSTEIRETSHEDIIMVRLTTSPTHLNHVL